MEESAEWGTGLTGVDLLVIVVMFLETFGAVCKLSPVMVGGPTETFKHKDVQVVGTAACSLMTPIVSENEAILLRTCLGRTLTCFHGIGGRHVIQGFYIDVFLDEFRGKNPLKRPGMWCAWVEFVAFLCKIKTRAMGWEKQLPPSGSFSKTEGLPEPSSSSSGPRAKIFRTLRVNNHTAVEFDCGLSEMLFEGVAQINDPAYESYHPDKLSVMSTRDDEKFTNLQTRSLDHNENMGKKDKEGSIEVQEIL